VALKLKSIWDKKHPTRYGGLSESAAKINSARVKWKVRSYNKYGI